ncbi:MAG TPA: tetratricopeptide repeat protein [Terriglobales bacterium]|jgi:tetratricopeptide (TPR) repeat protein|nr:tetratricopeptide repeat protein [Terriglobales bacterium]
MRSVRQFRVAIFLIAIFLSALSLAQSSGQTVRHHKVAETESPASPELTKAESAIEKKDYSTAEPLLKQIVEASPKNYLAWFDLGFIYNTQGDTQQSIDAYRKSVEAKPDVFESNLNLGLMLAKAGQPDSEKYLLAATALKPTAHIEEGQARAWMSLGHVMETSNPAGAIDAYQKASALQPKDPEPLLSAGVLLEKQNQLGEAERSYKAALALAPDSGDAMTALANLYMRSKRFPEAQDVLRKLVVLHPDDSAAQMQLGRILAASGQKDEAIAQLEAASKRRPQDLDLHRDLAQLYLDAGKTPEAEAEYQTLVAAQPNDAQLHFALGQTMLKQRKFPEAQQEFVKVITIKPDYGEAYGELAVTANEAKNYPMVIKALDARAKLLPEIPVGYFLRATAYDHLRDAKNASANYHKFLEVADGKFPDQEWQAKHRLIAIEPKK